MRKGVLAAALAAVVGAGPAAAQYDLPLSRPASGEVPDPKPVYKYELKPEHGEFLVVAQTFRAGSAVDTEAKKLAEGLAEFFRSE
jgi:hypothetical protein